MNRMFYQKLALTNIINNRRVYFPYVMTCICTIAMFYIMHSISTNDGLNGMSGSQSLKSMLLFGAVVIGIFSGIFLFYTNSFLLKRRKKEIGLYNILGLEKKHIAKILFFENVMISMLSLVVGLLGGIILNKLMFLLLLKLLAFTIKFSSSISVKSLLITTVIFLGIFIITLLYNLFHISLAKPIVLLKGGQVGEKEPKTKWIMTIVGLVSLGAGYNIALTVKSPLSALNMFFVAVILVIVGTYLLFTTGSITLLKLLRKSRNFYYKTQNFTAVSGMIYRMKQNAVGLANICILSTAVIVMLSTTVSLYTGMEDALKNRFPRNVSISLKLNTEAHKQKLKEILNTELERKKLSIRNMIDFTYIEGVVKKTGDKFKEVDIKVSNKDVNMLVFMPLSDYNRLEGRNVTLDDDQVLIFSTNKTYGMNTIKFENQKFRVKEELNTLKIEKKNSMRIVESYIIVINNLDAVSKTFNGVNASKQATPACLVEFDLDAGDKEIISFTSNLNHILNKNNIKAAINSAAINRESFLTIYGGLFFLGIFLGILFLMATVLIIYYKQISEGYDDKERFEIMQKVGMSKSEIKSTIRRQILMVFFLPIVFAVIHISFAFPIIRKLMAVFDMVKISLILMATAITILVFAVIYGIVFSLTAKAYYKIVE